MTNSADDIPQLERRGHHGERTPSTHFHGHAQSAVDEDRSRQFEVFDRMVAQMVGGPNEPVK